MAGCAAGARCIGAAAVEAAFVGRHLVALAVALLELDGVRFLRQDAGDFVRRDEGDRVGVRGAYLDPAFEDVDVGSVVADPDLEGGSLHDCGQEWRVDLEVRLLAAVDLEVHDTADLLHESPAVLLGCKLDAGVGLDHDLLALAPEDGASIGTRRDDCVDWQQGARLRLLDLDRRGNDRHGADALDDPP